jgi:NADH-quinone oxidoreductase subunit L
MVNESSILAIFLLPLASFVVIGLVIRPFFNMYSWLSGYLLIAALVLSVVLSASVLNAVVMGQEVQLTAIPWLDVGGAVIEFSLFVDPLTAVMLLVVTSVSLMVQIYSLGYMRGDPSYARYFAYMSLFTASMLGLVLAANVIVLYAFWELVGVSSYLLIGFWHDRPAAAAAAKKAFLITRIGDVGFLLAILYLFFQADEFAAAGLNPFHIPDIFQAAAPLAAGGAILGGAGLTWLTLGIFAGAVGKSGQFPLHSWLPDAMEGPTPVSALIHAATMVAAGVFLVGRFYPLFLAAQHTLTVVALVGAFTALMAATMGLVMNDIKRVMAYSTVSQLGYMMAALGLGAFPAAIFHLVTHAAFKALLFLGAGSVNHATGTFDMRYMGGLRRYMPLTYWMVVIGGLSLVGIFPLAGFWSKDEILVGAWNGTGLVQDWVGGLTFILLLIGVLLTAFYTVRMIYLTFHGEFRGGVDKELEDQGALADAGHHGAVHLGESPAVMLLPMALLAVPAVIAGFLINPQWVKVFGIPKHWVTEFLVSGVEAGSMPSVVHLEIPDFNIGMAILSTIIALVGMGMAALLYSRRSDAAKDPLEVVQPIHGLLSRKYFIDTLYEDLIVRKVFYGGLVAVLDWLDRVIVDGVVESVGFVLRHLAPQAVARLQTGEVQAYGVLLTIGTLIIVVGFLLL